MSIDRRKRVVVAQHGDHVHEEHIVENVNLEYREAVYKVTQIVWLFFGALEALIGIRVVLKLIGANPGNWFTALIYGLSQIVLWPFQSLVALEHRTNNTFTASSTPLKGGVNGIRTKLHKNSVAHPTTAVLCWFRLDKVPVSGPFDRTLRQDFPPQPFALRRRRLYSRSRIAERPVWLNRTGSGDLLSRCFHS